MKYLNVLAKALYDNVAESPDELSFRKGDIMTVLERDTQGLDGWWLCSLHGRQGIVPGNRLKILVGMYDKKPAAPGPGPPATPPQPQPSLPQGVHTPVPPASQYSPMLPTAYQPQPDNVYLVPTPSKTQQGLYQALGPTHSSSHPQPNKHPHSQSKHLITHFPALPQTFTRCLQGLEVQPRTFTRCHLPLAQGMTSTKSLHLWTPAAGRERSHRQRWWYLLEWDRAMCTRPPRQNRMSTTPRATC